MSTFSRIGVFDSGLGGLTVLNAICAANKGLSIVYFGDTARVPYGSRPPETIIRYAEQDVRFLLSKGVEAIVVACGTVSAIALEELRKEFSIPIIGVGGIARAEDVLEFLLAGADAVEVGAMNFVDPYICVRIIDDLERVLSKYGYTSVRDVIERRKLK